MSDVRRAFRYDVEIPMHLEPVDRFGKHLNAERRQLIRQDEEQRLQYLSQEIAAGLEQIFKVSSQALYIFYVLNHRLDFMWWLLDLLIDSQDPREQTDFLFRRREDQKFQAPADKNQSSAVAPLVLGLFAHIDQSIKELLQVVEGSIDGKIFMFSADEITLFDDKKFVKNLTALDQKGVLPAQVLRTMIAKLNLQLKVLKRLKAAYQTMANNEQWPIYKANLSAGGFGFHSAQPYVLFGAMDVFMQLDKEVIICRGKVVSQEQVNSMEEPERYRVGVEFYLLTREQELIITLFEQRQELAEAMQKVTL